MNSVKGQITAKYKSRILFTLSVQGITYYIKYIFVSLILTIIEVLNADFSSIFSQFPQLQLVHQQ